MATRTMIDCTHVNVGAVRREFPGNIVIAGYVTGSANIKWTDADLAEFRGSQFITIDQGGIGSPVPDAMVRDVEPGAWTAVAAVRHTPWNTPRPTIYCDRSDLRDVIAAGWHGDVWLAWPGYAGSSPPQEPGVNVVAVQNVFGTDHDSSIIYDGSWPHIPNLPGPTPVLSVTVTNRAADAAFPVMPGADHYIIKYRSAESALPVVLERVKQQSSGPAVHVTAITVPGSHGGVIDVYGVVSSVQHLVGSATLP